MQNEYLSAVDVPEAMLRHPSVNGAYVKTIVRLGGLEMPMLLSPYEGFCGKVYQECGRIIEENYMDGLC